MIILLFLQGCGDKENEESPESLYSTYCGLCHGEQGEGYVSPQANALNNPEFLAAATDDFLRESTIYGRPETKMSAWGGDGDMRLGITTRADFLAERRTRGGAARALARPHRAAPIAA